MADRIRIFIVDDHEIFRNGLKTILGKSSIARITGEASNGQEFLELYDPEYADIVLMDIEMPVLNGIEASKAVLEKFPDARIIALTFTPPFFKSLGFVEVPKEQLMHKIYSGCMSCTKYEKVC